MVVSLLFLTYNRKGMVIRSLSEALRTIGDADVEIIILDNASTDGTTDWLLALAARQPRVKVFCSTSNRGVSPGRQFLLGQAYGDILIFLDSDVSFHPGWLPPIVEALEDFQVGIVGHGGYMVKPGWTGFTPNTDRERAPDVLAGYCQAFRRDLLDSGVRIDPAYGKFWHEDSDFCLQAREKGYKLLQLDLPIRHIHAGSGAADARGYEERLALLKQKWAGKGLVQIES